MNPKNKLPLVTIITIVHNNVKTIKTAVQSVAHQSYENIGDKIVEIFTTNLKS